MRGGLGCAVGLVLACTLASACNEPDVIAGPVVISGVEPDGGELDCKLPAQLARAGLPIGLANVFFTCEWPLDAKDSPDDLHWFFWDIGVQAGDDHLCDVNPYRYWQEPPFPSRPKQFVFCPGICNLMKSVITCILSGDVCNADRPVPEDCAFLLGPIDPCRLPPLPNDEDAGRPPFCK